MFTERGSSLYPSIQATGYVRKQRRRNRILHSSLFKKKKNGKKQNNSSRIYLSYLFDLPVMPICIQSHCHLSKEPIVALLTMATLYLKCANLATARCGIHIKMSFLYLIAFISDSEYYYHQPAVTLIKNKADSNQCTERNI